MERRTLGGTNLTVSRVALGTMTFGAQADEAAAAAMIDDFLARGGDTIDTANVYNAGAAERILGKLLKGRRDRVVLASKVVIRMGDGPGPPPRPSGQPFDLDIAGRLGFLELGRQPEPTRPRHPGFQRLRSPVEGAEYWSLGGRVVRQPLTLLIGPDVAGSCSTMMPGSRLATSGLSHREAESEEGFP